MFDATSAREDAFRSVMASLLMMGTNALSLYFDIFTLHFVEILCNLSPKAGVK